MKKPQSFSCEESDWEKLDVIAQKFKTSRNKLIQTLVSNVLRTGEIELKKSEGSIDSQLKQAQLTKAKNQNGLHDLKKRNLDATVRINEYHADNVGVVGSRPSTAAKDAMVYHVTGNYPYSEDAIRCWKCKDYFTNAALNIEHQISQITSHMKTIHEHTMTEDEAQELSELIV